MKTYTLLPQDLLFFRDGRPIETSGGHGARWPEPSVIFDALHAALWRAFPARQTWEHWHDFGRSSHRPRNGDTQRFGALVTAGLFPVWKDGRWLFPAPTDVVPSDEGEGWLLRPQRIEGENTTNRPATFLQFVVANFARPTKNTIPPWWTAAAWRSYLRGEKPARSELFENRDLFSGEWTTGIGIDSETQTQDGERIYSAEYLRLRPEIRCGFAASLRMKQDGDPGNVSERIGELFAANDTIIVGGQQRSCRVEEWTDGQTPLPIGEGNFHQNDGKYLVKWVLLTPAIWPRIEADDTRQIPSHPGGWLPNWICPATGGVLLRHRTGKVRRVWDDQKKRTVRKADHEAAISANLVAACVGKPIPVTGWTERLHLVDHEQHWAQAGAAHGPKPTHLAVPAGAVYYFACDSEPDARALAAALNWHGDPVEVAAGVSPAAGVAAGVPPAGDSAAGVPPAAGVVAGVSPAGDSAPGVSPAAPRGKPNPPAASGPAGRMPASTIRNRRSTLLGEKGFGLGVCGTWQLHDATPA